MSNDTTPPNPAMGTFAIDLTQAEPLLPDTGHLSFTKTWDGDLAGTSRGVMLSAGNPASGSAGYVALEVFDGAVNGRRGTFCLQQFGAMSEGVRDLRYEVVPGSGTGELSDLSGIMLLTVDDDGAHHVSLRYEG